MAVKTDRSTLCKLFEVLSLPEVIFLAILLLAYFGDKYLGIWTFIYNYRGFLNGFTTTPILPYTIFMAGASFSATGTLLYVARVKIWRIALISASIPLAAMATFEYVWNFLFLLKDGNFSSWFGLGPVWVYSFGFLSLSLFALTGVKYWKFSASVAVAILSTIVVFVSWYVIGYPQSGPNIINSTLFPGNGVSLAYILNVATKLFVFITFAAPVVSWGILHSGNYHNFSTIEMP